MRQGGDMGCVVGAYKMSINGCAAFIFGTGLDEANSDLVQGFE